MSNYSDMVDQLEDAVEYGCDYELVEEAKNMLKDCRNQLCQYCGRYTQAHNGACNGCRWK